MLSLRRTFLSDTVYIVLFSLGIARGLLRLEQETFFTRRLDRYSRERLSCGGATVAECNGRRPAAQAGECGSRSSHELSALAVTSCDTGQLDGPRINSREVI
jgi:hypothetical protein